MLKGKGAVGRRLREDNTHLSSQIYNDITETVWNIIWYYIYIVKNASEHYICTFFMSKNNYAYESNSEVQSWFPKKKERPAQNHLAKDRDERDDGDGSNMARSQSTGQGWVATFYCGMKRLSKWDRQKKYVFHASFHCKNYFGQFSSSHFVLINFEKVPTWASRLPTLQ